MRATTYCHNCKDFFNGFIYGQPHFHNNFFKKSLCENRCSAQRHDKQRWITAATQSMGARESCGGGGGFVLEGKKKKFY